MCEYIWTPKQLREVHIAEIGTLDNDHASMVAKAKDEADKAGVTKPLIVIALNFKPGAHPTGLEEYVYPINADEWSTFQADSKRMCSSTPTVHVVDGEKYTAPI